MNQPTKTLTTIWVTSIATFSIIVLHVLSKEEHINAPGELREVLTSTAFPVLAALITISTVIILINHKK